ncbi:signal peptidase complex subunit 3, putative [Plasmodium ovale]|uniref:Signal peptidase complex subunit 3 n=2 Tax=Plasmodium ovale TaxID=36330 RepID=A0A1A8VME8_PLAOA|nr:signal peptidase complex subunit 3, putative (SPC3) [Plasmodium ovale curtisi]SBS84636.1 signal peptidase complex subunit 3, putative (SPC3) [Plasmodium ovale curtisi]SCQ16032.1 signal peptidase complex subunit 3, putative [Plasmodium ovale]
MDNFLNRINVLFYSMAFCFIILCTFNFGTSFYLFDEKEIKTAIDLKSVRRLVYNKYIKGDEAVLTLDLSFDMRKAFNWNLKQIFLYVLVTYETPEKIQNEVIIHDFILNNKNEAIGNFKNILNKYSLKDYYNGLRNNTIQLQVCYKYMPKVGFSRSYEGAKISYRLPNEYFDKLSAKYPLYSPDR